MRETDEPADEEKKILFYLLGTSVSYIVLVGGLIVFILILLNVDTQILGGLFLAYLSLALSIMMSFHRRILKRFGLRKYFGIITFLILLLSMTLLSNYILSW